MGLIYASITISNPVKQGLEPIEARSLVDTGALHLCIPEHIAIQLQLSELEKREVMIADGKRVVCPYVGPVKLQFDNRSCFTGALVLGDTVLLGAIPIEDMDLVVHPATLKLTANPLSPNIPSSTVMGIDDIKFDTTAFSVSEGFDIAGEIEYWQSRSPEERLNAVEFMRQINYGTSYPRSIQRFFEIA